MILVRIATGLVLCAVGVWCVLPYVPREAPRAAQLIQLTGPLRGMPVPFAWARVGRASERQNRRARRSPAWLLAQLMPEQPELLYDLAWRRIYDDGALATSPAGRAAALLDGLAILDEAAALHPEDPTPLAWQGFHLLTRCSDMEDAAAVRTAFTRLAGQDAIELAAARLDVARRRSGGQDWTHWLRANALEFLAAQDLDRAATPRVIDRSSELRAAEKLRSAVILWHPSNPERAALLSRFATALEIDRSSLRPEDRASLGRDLLFGRKAGSWLRRLRK